ncbi:MAG: hypothetical protein SOT71_13815 [Romboutsia timonensis]|nr:hypothetical protein [Romboutsia timonensis]MDY2883722.1 hypothetical protein [Romboutsia timonensis]
MYRFNCGSFISFFADETNEKKKVNKSNFAIIDFDHYALEYQ